MKITSFTEREFFFYMSTILDLNLVLELVLGRKMHQFDFLIFHELLSIINLQIKLKQVNFFNHLLNLQIIKTQTRSQFYTQKLRILIQRKIENIQSKV